MTRARSCLAMTLLFAASAACEQRVVLPIDPASVTWQTYDADDLGVRLEHPTAWVPVARGNTVAFQGARATAMRITLADRGEAEKRGLWGRTPVVRVDTIGGLSFAFYRYRHYDGPSYVPTLAFVVGHRGLELGVEFRTHAEEPGDAERHVLESLRLR